MTDDRETNHLLDTGLINTLVNIFVSPLEAFDSIKAKPSILFPLLLLLLCNMAVYVWYFSVVDYPWLVDQLIQRLGDIPADQLSAARDVYISMASTGMMISSTVSIVVMMLLVYSVQAGYLSLVSALIGAPYRFRQWFSLNCWAFLPGLLVVLVSMMNILLSENGQIGLVDLNSLSLHNLGFDGGKNMTMNALLDSLSLATFWALGLLVVAFNGWVETGYFKAALIVLMPYGLVYGIWAMIALS